MNHEHVFCVDNYGQVDGRNAYRSDIKKLTLGAPVLDEHKSMQLAVQIWRESEGRMPPTLKAEIPVHQIFDLMIFFSSVLLHFKEAYRLPKLYDPEKPLISKIGVQGAAMDVAVCRDNPQVDEDMQAFAQALSDLDEITGERLRVLERVLEEVACY